MPVSTALSTKKRCVDMIHFERIDALVALYARRLADVMNRGFRIEAMPSTILIGGQGDFPVKRKGSGVPR